MMYLSEVADVLNTSLVGLDSQFEQLSTDSRNITKGELFVALRGDHFDGHRFIDGAVTRGACAVVVDTEQKNLEIPQIVVEDTLLALGAIAALKRQKFTGKVIAVTGSSGKTTVKGMLLKVLSKHGATIATEGNFNNQIGVPLTLMKLSQEDFAVVELGTSNPGEINYLTQLIDPDCAVVTNVMPAHIGGFGSLDAIAKEKGHVYLLERTAQVVINTDCIYSDDYVAQTGSKEVIGFSMNNAEQNSIPVVYADNIVFSDEGLACFDICYGDLRAPLKLMVPGRHNVSNALAASAVALACGLDLSLIAAGLSEYGGEKGRMNTMRGLQGARILDDSYNANPGSVCAAIDALELYSGVRILVLGDMGELGVESELWHKKIGLYASEMGIEFLYAWGENSQFSVSEFGSNGFIFKSKQELVNTLKMSLTKDTTVLIKGSRSAKMEEVVKGLCIQESQIC